ncbi:MAG: tetratricopeptide repeat protein [Cytophagales bacterium]|nr:tetratricopeptide repeat protein [Cytophagales bacterium]
MKNLFLYLLIFNIFRQCVPLCAQSSNISEEAQKLYKQAGQYYDSGFFENAIEYYKKSLEINPNFSFAYTYLGHAYYNLNEIDKAIESYKRTIDINEKTGEYGNLGWCFILQGEFTQAIQACEKAVKYNPHTATHRFNLAHAYLLKGDSTNAKELYRKALSLLESKEQFKAITEDFLLFIKNGWQVEACRKVLEWMQQEIENIDRLYEEWQKLHSLTQQYFQKGHYYKALQYGEKALLQADKEFGKLDTNYANTLTIMGEICYYLGKVDKSINYFEKDQRIRKKILSENNLSYAKTISWLAYLYLTKKNYSESEKLYLEGMKIIKMRLGENNPEYVNFLYSLAVLYQNVGRNREAEENYLRSIEIIETQLSNNHPLYETILSAMELLYAGIWESLYDSVVVYYNNANYKKAIEFLKLALVTIEKGFGKNNPNYTYTLNDLASCYDFLGNYSEAEALFIEAINIDKSILGENDLGYSSHLNNLALHYKQLGRYPEAEELYLEATNIRKTQLGENHPFYAQSLNNLAALYEKIGRYYKAEALHLEAMKIRKTQLEENDPEYAQSLNALGVLYYKIGRYSDAEKLYLEAIKIYTKQLGKNRIIVNAPVVYALYLNNLAVLYKETGRYVEAEKLYLRSKKIVKAELGENHPDYAQFISTLASFYYITGRYIESEELFLEAINIEKNQLGVNNPEYTTTTYNLAGLYVKMGRYAEAEKYFEQAMDNYLYQIQAYFPSMSEKEKGEFYNTIKENFEKYYSFIFTGKNIGKLNVEGKVYNYRLATKALLINSTNKVRQRIMSSNDTVLIQKYKQWRSKRNYLGKLYSLSKAEIEKQGVNIDDLEKEANNLERALSKSSELFKLAYEKQTITWQHVQAQLKENEAAIEIIRFRKYGRMNDSIVVVENDGFTDTVYYIALIITKETKDHPELVVLENGNELEKKYLFNYRNSIKFKMSDKISYRQYWYKIAQTLSQSAINKVWFSPDGVYNLINLNTLQIPDNGKYLLENTDIRIVTNTKDIITVEARPLQSPNPENLSVFFGYPNYELGTQERIDIISQKQYNTPQQYYVLNIERGENLQMLPGTRQEVEEISNILAREGWKQQVFLENQALEENLKAVTNPKVLHIATHGFFNKDSDDETQDNPLLNAGLMLAGASTTLNKSSLPAESLVQAGSSIRHSSFVIHNLEDGILTAYEAMNLNLDKTDLVVLSACETALGEVRNGEGVYGLQRAFIIAGAQAIIMSLWKVNDVTTRELMITFYKNWVSSGNKQDAFKKAQLSLKEKYKFPYYWGAFVMIGE